MQVKFKKKTICEAKMLKTEYGRNFVGLAVYFGSPYSDAICDLQSTQIGFRLCCLYLETTTPKAV